MNSAFLAAIIASGTSFAVVSSSVVLRSAAAFSATTDSARSSLNGGSVELSDNDAGGVLFDAMALAPGDSVSRCITVTYNGSITAPAAVRIYSSGLMDSGDFASFVNLRIEEGTGGTLNDCSAFTSSTELTSGGTLADFAARRVDYSSGLGSWRPSSRSPSITH